MRDGVAIDTARLRMRTMVEADEALYCELFGDARTMQLIGAPWSRERAQQSFAKMLASMRRRPIERVVLTIVDRAAGHELGLCTLQSFDHARRSAELGIMLRPEAQARRIGTEAVAALIAWGFATCALDEIGVRIAVNHMACERIIIPLGFSRREIDQAWQTWYVDRAAWDARAQC